MSDTGSFEALSYSGDQLVLGVLASGRGSNLKSIIDAIESGRLSAKIGVVVSNKKEAGALECAKKHHIPRLYVDPSSYPDKKAYDTELSRILKAHQVGLVILAGYMRLLTGMLISAYPYRIMNVHPSLLPAFPGLHAQRQALSHGVKVSGCTIHFVDEEMDHGPIIAQAAVPVRENDTEDSLSERILREEHRLFPEVIRSFSDRSLGVDGRRVCIVPDSLNKAENFPVKDSP
ncbi:MAG: phosphoribosylglycinamide formyltransferase [Nitrospira sp.]|nr:phosphoribosylglycinamide formyltransferase [Candidatus Manganitrophaceae bacterium]HIL33911.1 phosphoribosylglycinamide formyltransferase [Candidatus Manganitrophaceae bacterium]